MGMVSSLQMKEMSGLGNLDSGFISSIFSLKLPTANLNATCSIMAGQARCTVRKQLKMH